MAVALEQFVKQLEDSGVIDGDTLKDFIPPNASPKDAEELARELVRQKKLTKFQAEELWRGKGKSLVLGNYVLLEKIGAGGMGQVFKARHTRMDRLVAVKLLPAAMTKDKAAIARFSREVQAAAKLRHTNIVAADDADQANGVHFLVMELVDGSDLSALVKANGPLSVEKAVNYILQAARGLEAAHAEGVVHRDIKPANLLLDKKGTVKILDMGLARIGGDAAGQAELTATGAIMGTVDFMAPEQALNTKGADARADIYALGCSLFYLLTGKATYDGDTLMAKLLAHRDQPIPDLRTICPHVPEPLEAVFKKMVAKKVEDRHQTMTEVLAALESCGGGQTFNPPSFVASDAGLTNFLKDIAGAASTVTVSQQVALVKDSKSKVGNKHRKPLLISGGVLGVLVLIAGLVISLKTKDGTLVVTVNEPDADVQVLNEKGKVEITRKGEKGPITISVDPGKHRLKVQKDGFNLYTKEFEIESGGKKSFTAKLVPVDDRPAVVKAAPMDRPWDSPAFKKWINDVAAMPAEQQVDAVSKKLMQLNPGFDGKLVGAYGRGAPKISKGEVVEAGFASDAVNDISPVRALVRLKVLYCRGKKNNSVAVNASYLSPLQGMPLTTLFLDNNKHISDLAPLEHCPNLKRVRATGINVTAADVAALQKTLPNCKIEWDDPGKSNGSSNSGKIATFDDPAFQQWVQDVAAMRADKQVEAVSKKLQELNPGFDGKVTRKTENGVVTELQFFTDKVANISPVRALAGLKSLDGGNNVRVESALSDLSPLTGMQITKLAMYRTNVDDLTPLKGMPLSELLLQGTRVTDVSPLQGLPLKGVYLALTDISDISPLKGMRLSSLALDGTGVSNLSPVKGMPLTDLTLFNTTISDLTPLQGMSLKSIGFTPARITKGLEIVRNMQSIEVIDVKWPPKLSPAEFWKKYDAGEFGKPVTITAPAIRVDPDRRAAEMIAERGGSLTVHVGNDYKNISKKSELPGESFKVVYVELYHRWSLTDADMAQLAGLDRLSTLLIHSTAVTAKGLELMRDQPNLSRLGYSRSDAASMTAIGRFKALKSFEWPGAGVTAPAVKSLQDLPQLDGLGLSSDDLDDATLSALGELTKLKILGLDATRFNESSLKHLKNLTSLESLRLSDTFVSDAGLAPLTSLTGLRHLGLQGTRVTAAGVAALKKTLPNCLIEWDGPPKPITDFNSLVFQQWMKDVATMPAEGQVEAVGKKLVEFNPGFDGKVTPKIEGRVVTEITFIHDNISDISPIRALPGLKALHAVNLHLDRGKLSNLSPLQGMKLTILEVYNTEVEDLMPLKGMPLNRLDVSRTKVSDLSPLEGMALAFLNFGTTHVTDLSPLREMNLTTLVCDASPVSDLSPLRSMKLSYLDCANTQVIDLSPLEEMNLSQALFTPKRITKGIETIRQMKGLQTIGTHWSQKLPAAQFWKKYDAGEFGNPQ